MTIITKSRRHLSLPVLLAAAVAATVLPSTLPASAGVGPTVDMTGRDLDFVHPTTISDIETGDAHRFTNVITVDGMTVDAIVTVTAAVNSKIDDDDHDRLGVWALDRRSTDPTIDRYLRSAVEAIDEDETASVTYTIEFVQQGTDTPVTLENLNMQVYDLDVRQYVEVPGASMYWLSKGSRVTPSLNAGVLRLTGFPQGTAPEAPGYFSYTLGRAEVAYPAVSEVVVTLGFPNAGNLELDFSDAGLPWESFGANIRRDGVLANDVTVPVGELELLASANKIHTGETAHVAVIGDPAATMLCVYAGTSRIECIGTGYFPSPSLFPFDDLFPDLGATTLSFRIYAADVFGDGSEVDLGTPYLDSVAIELIVAPLCNTLGTVLGRVSLFVCGQKE